MMVKLGKRIVAGVLAGVLCVSSGLMPVSTVRAEEIASKEVEEVITAGEDAENGASSISDNGTANGSEDESADTATGDTDNETGDDVLPGDESEEEGPEEDQEENPVEGEITEEELAKDIEEDIETVEADTVSANTLSIEDDNIASGVIDEEYGHITWVIDNNLKLTVTGTGDFAVPDSGDYDRAPWYGNAYSIESAEINVQGMKDASYMFGACNELTSVDLHNFDTKDVENMRGMFNDCYSLTSLDLSGFHTENVTKMSSMFFGCSGLTSLDLSSFHTENVIRMNEMFYGCSGLSRLDLSSFSTEKVINIDNMFGECRNLSWLNLSSFDLGNLGDVNNEAMAPFYACIKLTTVYTPQNLKEEVSLPSGNWYHSDGSKWKTLPLNMSESIVINKNKIHEEDLAGGSFQDIIWFIDTDRKLTVRGTGEFASNENDKLVNRDPWQNYKDDFDFAEVDVTGMTNARGMFYGCDKLQRVDFSNFDTSQVTDMSYMFSGCSSLTSLNLSNFSTEKVTDIGSMFSGCSSLTFLDLSSFDLGSLAMRAETLLENCDSLETIYTPRNLAYSVILPIPYEYKDSWYQSDGSKLEYLPIYRSDSIVINKNKIHTDDIAGGRYENIIWFIDTDGKLTVKGRGEFGPDEHNVSNRGPWWYYSEYIVSAKVSVSGLTNASGMFGGCGLMESVDLSNFDTSQVTDMGSMFSGCYNLGNLDLTGFNTSQVTDMGSMFSGCYNLENLNLSSFNTSRVTYMGYMFEGCSNLTTLDLSSFDTSQVTGMYDMFLNCYNLTDLDLSSFETSQVTDMRGMFSSCGSLINLDLSNLDLSSLKRDDEFEWGSGEQLSFQHATDLNMICTPRNIPRYVHISLSPGTWYQPDGTVITELPHLDHSILIMKDKVPSIAEPYITASKKKTAYKCGDPLDLSDLTVRYYGTDGKVIFVSDYSTNADQIDMSTPGIKQLEITYNGLAVTIELTVAGTVTGKEKVEISGLSISDSIYSGRAVTYRGAASVRTSGGKEVTGETTLTYSYSGTMADGSNYPASDRAPVNAGKYTLTAAVSQDDSSYTGSAEYPFTISPAQVTITASDITYGVGVGQALPDSYDFQVKGLLKDDLLTKQPSFTLTDKDGKEISKGDISFAKEGSYYIVPAGADAGMNYEIAYRRGILSITEERVAYTVRFEGNGHADEISPITGIKAGSLIDAPQEPKADGYLFKGWYKDPSCTKAWNFATDTVQEDTVLYACWITAASAGTQGISLCIQEIHNPEYTGSALKPAVSVYSGDGETLLKTGKDYTIKYYNNVEADTAGEESMGGVSSTGQEGDNGFTKKLAYVVITGKGNYAGNVYKNFHISPVSISAEDGKGNLTTAAGFKLKYTEQLTVSAAKAQKPFASLKYKKAMKAGKDYEVVLRAMDAFDEKGSALEKDNVVSRSDGNGTLPAIPKGCQGTFLLTVTGMGNYCGSIEKMVYVADKAFLLKNVAVTLGKNQKTVKDRTAEELQKGITLTPAFYNTSDKKYYAVDESGTVSTTAEPDGSNVFTVKAGKTYLVYGKDYTVSYADNRAVGTAVMTITGTGKYTGTKNVSFKITGTAFQAKNIMVDSASLQTAVPYNGKAWIQNKAVLYPKDGSTADALTYGVDYTISYKNNVNKGTATMTFTAKPDSGYSGSFKKTFKITQAEISSLAAVTDADSMTDQNGGNHVTYDDSGEIRLEKPVPYTRAGVKPAGMIRLVNKETGTVLQEGRDYRVSYKNHNAVTDGKTTAADKKPVMVITGKGNYKGTLAVSFEIGRGVISPDDIIVPALALNTKSSFQYTPKVKVMDGKKVLRVGADKDYTITYRNNDQVNVTQYANGEAGAKTPEAVIQVPSGSSYRLYNAAGEAATEISMPLKLYSRALKKSELYVVVEEPVYSGTQLRPQGDNVRVYLGDSSSVRAANRAKEDREEVLTAQEGQYRLTRLVEGTDYVLDYGTNIVAGKNKGSLTVTGNSLKYGGSVTVKFTILSREIYKNGTETYADNTRTPYPCFYDYCIL